VPEPPAPGVLVLSASPRPHSRPDWLGDHVTALLTGTGCCTARHRRVRDLPARALLAADPDDPQVRAATAEVAGADGVVLVTPIYRAAYAGLLKVFLDVLPRYAFAGKAVLPLATGGSRAHTLALDYALRPVLQAMGSSHVARGHFVHDSELVRSGIHLVAAPDTVAALGPVTVSFREALAGAAPHELAPARST